MLNPRKSDLVSDSTFSSDESAHNIPTGKRALPAVLFLAAFLLRVIYALYVTPVDWNWDSYHHWQIAYYTLTLGFAHGRMWDLMGSEYQWPPLPILTQSVLIWLFGTSIWSMRILNMLLGSVSAVLAYFVGKHRNEQVGIISGLLLAISPIIAFTDVLGLSESMMLLFSLLGLLMVCRGHVFYAGAAFGLASLCHFFAYPLVLILVAYELLRGDDGTRTVPVIAGYGLVMVSYAYLLYLHTGNPLYVFGLLTSPTYGVEVREMYAALGILMIVPALIGFVHLLRKKNWGAILVFSFSELLFYGGYLTVRTPPLFGAERYYVLLSAFVSFLLAYYLDALRSRFHKVRFAHLALVALVISVTLTAAFAPRFVFYQGAIGDFYRVADWIGSRYHGGTIISEQPVIAYFLIDQWKIRGDLDILGAHYIPFERGARDAWLREHNVTWIIYSNADFDYTNRVFPELADGGNHPPFIVAQQFGWMIVYNVYTT